MNDKEKRADILMSSITLYTTQLEDYDKSNFSACMTCIGFVGGLIAAVGAILCTASNGKNAFLLNEAVSVIILLIPAIVTLFLYNFSMSCRRSALFRGYLQYLEEQLNNLMQEEDMLYSSFLIPQYYSKFPVNFLGPVAMIVFLVILYGLSFGISYLFASKSASDSFIICYKIGCGILFALCTIFDIIYVVSLLRNDKVIKKIKDVCERHRSLSRRRNR